MATLAVTAPPSAAATNGNHTHLTDGQVAALKASMDRTAWDIGPTPPLTAQQKQLVKEKMAGVQAFQAAHPTSSAEMTADPEMAPDAGGVLASDSVAANQMAQTTTYYCGPAAVKEALGQRGIGGIQSNLADAMNTTLDGTAWSGVNADVPSPTGHPVPDVLNDRLSSHGQNFTYVPKSVAYSATSSDISNYKGNLLADIYYYSFPLVGDAYEVPGGPHLVGHPNITIFHWFDIRGYTSSGDDTKYEDSVHGSSISWADGVPAYSTLTSAKIARIVGGRGYVW
ncbi:MAG TPA: hypothetical protein VFJ19_19720 [Nocardioidaceae bacterium]|nr:hypothetical protein [Nocardioidaceae bacterium]